MSEEQGFYKPWSDDRIEQEIDEKQLNAPRVTIEMIMGEIDRKIFQRIEDTNVTICVLILKNGFSVIGHSACVSNENFNEEIGNELAMKNAIDQCWQLFGFKLACDLAK